MALDRDQLRQQMEQHKASGGGRSNLNFVKKGITRLRVVEFSSEGKTIFARKVVRWTDQNKKGQPVSIDRWSTYGLPCAFSALETLCGQQNIAFPYQRRAAYIVIGSRSDQNAYNSLSA